jgi:predicted ester cyclase
VRLDALMRERADALSNPDDTETTMITAKALSNRQTVERFLAGTHSSDQTDLAVIDQTFNADIRCHGFPGFDATSREEYKAWFRLFQGSFSDRAFEVTFLVADEDHVAVLWIVHADHAGDFAGIPAPGQRSPSTASRSIACATDGFTPTRLPAWSASAPLRKPLARMAARRVRWSI